MNLHSALFGDPAIDALFTDKARLQAMLDVEVALARACVDAGIAPASCLPAIAMCARADRFDLSAIEADAVKAGNIAIPLVRALTAAVAHLDADAANAVHIGATSQDIIDTAYVLQLRKALTLISTRIQSVATSAADHARTHRHTPMPGRTWLQQATPVTFGLKAAGWLDALHRDQEWLARASENALVLQFGGASGTLAALGAAAPDVTRALGAHLALPVPAMPWHAHRDRVAQVATALGIVIGTLGKIARDLSLLSQTEVAEAHEAPEAGRGGSSTMPHKRNPVGASVALAAAVRAPGLVATILSALPQEHERGLGGWQAEWETMPELVRLAGGACRYVGEALATLVVDTDRMAHNLDALGGLTQAEAVVTALAPALGKTSAREIVDAAARLATDQQRAFLDVLVASERVTAILDLEALTRLLTPRTYLGQSEAYVDAVLAAWAQGTHRHD